MPEKIILDVLTQDNASVRKQQYIKQGDKEYTLGKPCRRAYVNSTSGREEVQNELPLAQQNAIFSAWGDTPTVTENSDI